MICMEEPQSSESTKSALPLATILDQVRESGAAPVGVNLVFALLAPRKEGDRKDRPYAGLKTLQPNKPNLFC